MRQASVQRGTQHAERRIGVEHQLERADPVDAERAGKIRQCGGERAGRGRQRADQAVAGEGARALLVGDAVRQHGVLQRHQHAEVAGRRIDGADERHQRDQDDVLEVGESQPRQHHQQRAAEQERAQVVARRDHADGERQQRGAEQRSRRDDADLHRIVADRAQIGRQDDDGKAIAKAAQPARGVEQRDIGPPRDRRPGGGTVDQDVVHGCSVIVPSAHRPDPATAGPGASLSLSVTLPGCSAQTVSRHCPSGSPP